MIARFLSAFATAADAPLRDSPSEIDALYRKHRWRVLLAITLGYGFIYTCRLAIGLVKPSMIDAGVFTPEEFGLIGSALFYTYALGKLTNIDDCQPEVGSSPLMFPVVANDPLVTGLPSGPLGGEIQLGVQP